MHSEFINCPKCGIRNFIDDKVCGVCKQKLPIHKKSNDDTETKNLYKVKADQRIKIIIAFFLISVVGYFLLSQSNKKHETSNSPKDNLLSTSDSDKYLNNLLLSVEENNDLIKIPEYQIVKKELNNPTRGVVRVRIKKMILDRDLRFLAESIKAKIDPVQKRLYIFFILPEMREGNGAWACAEFEPNLNIRYIGNSFLEQKKINDASKQIIDFVGLWVDESMEGDVVIRIRKDKILGYVFEYISSQNPIPSTMPSVLKKITKRGQVIYKDIENSAGEYFVIEPNGNLSVYDNVGYIITFKKITN